MYDPTIATLGILAGILMLGVLFDIVQVLMWQRGRAEHDELRDENAGLQARIGFLEEKVLKLAEDYIRLAERVDTGEELCDGWHNRIAREGHRAELERRQHEALEERVRQLEEAGRLPDVAPVAPMLFAETVAALTGLPALRADTGIMPILPARAAVTVSAVPDNTDTSYTRETAAIVRALAKRDHVEVVDAQDYFAEVTA